EVLVDPTWTVVAPMNGARHSHTADLLGNGKVLVAGGATAASYISTAETYDPALNTWTTVGSLLGLRSSHKSAVLTRGKVLVCGGANGGATFLSSAELFAPATGTWTDAGPMADIRLDHTATALTNDTALVVGGRFNASGVPPVGTVAIYDAGTNTWLGTGP